MEKRLTLEVVPLHYDLFINVEEHSFDGTVTIHLRPQYPLSSFRFNSKNLALSGLEIKEGGKVIESSFDEKEDEFITVSLKKNVSRDFTVSIAYKGSYSQTMGGFYKSEYNGNALFSTHFEATDARQAFPCLDQPDMKSTFSISIQVPEGNIALSNNALRERKGNLFVFDRTPPMSTYIVAYVVGKLDYIEDSSFIPIRVYADQSEKHWGRFALQVAVRSLKFFSDYFGAEYPLPKLDMVAIPSFAMGAMENWGLITYRKTSLLFDEGSTPVRSKKNIAITVAHELAHMWFGNLVTMAWWEDLWLNEGFATWAATLAVSSSLQDILPWDAWSSFVSDEVESGMSMDSLRSTHSVAVKVNDPVEIDQIFDAISYSKGSSVIKMLENWLGPDVFRKGLASYIKMYSYANARTQNLWESLTETANQASGSPSVLGGQVDVAEVIDPWIKRDGFPYLIVEDMGLQLRLTQKRFTVGYEKEDQPWPIPVKILWMDPEPWNTSFIMTTEVMEIKKESPLYKLNDGVSGFYRVLYPEGVLERLLDRSLTAVNRMNLLSDQFKMARALKAPLGPILSLLSKLQDEDNYEVLSSMVSNLKSSQSAFYADEAKRNYFDRKILEIVGHKASSVDTSSYPADINQMSVNSLVIAAAIGAEHQDTIDMLGRTDPERMNPEYMRPYLSILVNRNEFDHVLGIYKTSTRPGEKQNALFALGTAKNEENIEYLFENIEFAEPHDSIYLFASLGSNLQHRNKIAGLYMSNFERIRDHINNAGLLRHSLECVLQNVVQDGEREKVFSFLDSLKDDREMKAAVDKCRDSLAIASEFRSRYKDLDFE